MAARRAAHAIRGRLAALARAALPGARGRGRVRERHGAGRDRGRFPSSGSPGSPSPSACSLSSTGFYATPKITWDRDTASGRPFLYFAVGAACSEVSVDTETGEMRVDRVDILHDAGRSLNPAIDMGQIEGGFVQGMGWLTAEELVFDEEGRLPHPCALDLQDPDLFGCAGRFSSGALRAWAQSRADIHRSKAVGEPPLMLALSVFSAITHAIASLAPGRVPPLDAPATPGSDPARSGRDTGRGLSRCGSGRLDPEPVSRLDSPHFISATKARHHCESGGCRHGSMGLQPRTAMLRQVSRQIALRETRGGSIEDGSDALFDIR